MLVDSPHLTSDCHNDNFTCYIRWGSDPPVTGRSGSRGVLPVINGTIFADLPDGTTGTLFDAAFAKLLWHLV